MAGQIVAKNCAILLGGREVSSDLNTVTITRNVETPENTTFGSSTRTRKPGQLGDWNISLGGFFNDQTGAIEHQLDALLSAATIAGVFPNSSTSACEIGYEGVSIPPEYAVEAPVDGMITLTATLTGSGPIDRTTLIVPLSACNTAGSIASSSRDNAASRASVAGYLRVTNTTANGSVLTLDVKMQHSPDDAAWSDLITFTQVTAGSVSERKVASSASRYTRAHITIAGSDPVFTLMASMS